MMRNEGDELISWIKEKMRDVKRKMYPHLDADTYLFADHPNYEAWQRALYGMAPDRFKPPILGRTPGYCADLVDAGIDPDRIKAVFALLFLE